MERVNSISTIMVRLLARLQDRVFLRYLLASVFALGMDFGTFLALLNAGTPTTLASALSYSLGIIAHWIISSRMVFTGQVAVDTNIRNLQKTLFVLSAIAGLCVTTAIVYLASMTLLDPRVGKLIAVGASFFVTWSLRRRIVFRMAVARDAA
ncbi:MAG: GtrA family protein [Sphingomonadaceae bacterium]